MIEMTRDAQEPRGRDRFSCSTAVWLLLQDLGQAFGWQPSGTTYLPPASLRISVPARRNYQPGDALDHKRLDAEDAVSWARALDLARQSSQFDTFLIERWAHHEPHSDVTIQTLCSLVFEFTEFAYGGEFTFAESVGSETHEDTEQRSSARST
jgi:hypothetical protein